MAQMLTGAFLNGPGDITSTIRGAAYVWAILHDPRIRNADW